MLPEQIDAAGSAWWYQAGQSILNQLIIFGQFILEAPLLAGSYLFTILLVAIIIRLLFKGIRVIFFFLVVALAAGYVYVTYVDPYLSSPTTTDSLFDDPMADLLRPSLPYEQALQNSANVSFLQSVRFGGITKAPDLTGTSLGEGIDILQAVAETFRGEVAYCHFGIKDRSVWLAGTYSVGLTVQAFTEDCFDLNYTQNATTFTHIHTHPSIAETIKVTPPSLLDIYMYRNFMTPMSLDYFKASTKFEFLVVASDRIWKVVIPDGEKTYNLFLLNGKGELSDEIGEDVIAAHNLQGTYACEFTDVMWRKEKDCTKVSPAERRQAVDDLLKIYRGWGVIVTEELRTPGMNI